MQLILSIDEIGIKKNMSSVEETNQNEKEIRNSLLNNILSYSTSNITDDNIRKHDKPVQDSHNSDLVHESNGTITDNDASVEVSDGSDEDSKIVVYETANKENSSDEKQSIKKEVDWNKNAPKEIKTDYEEDTLQEMSVDESQEKQMSPNGTSEINCDKNNDADMKAAVKSETEDVDERQIENIEVSRAKDGNESQIQDIDVRKTDSVEEKQTVDINESQLEDFETDLINTIPENVVNDSLEDIDDNQHSDRDNSKDNGPPTCSMVEEIIDIADEEKDSCDSTEDKGQLENKLVENKQLDADSSDESTKTQTILKNDTENIEKSSQIEVLDKTVEISTLDESNHCPLVALENIQNKENTTEIKDNSIAHVAKVEPPNKLMNFKLSNTLDILSDDEDSNTTKPESPKPQPEPEPSNKQCINIEDDDDIMLIDDESTTKENKMIANDVEKLNIDSKEITNVIDEVENKQDVKEDTIQTLQSNDPELEDATKVNEEKKEIDKPEDKIEEKSPLLSSTFLKSFKTNLSEMTREELEDFCILKIVESVFDKSNLGEIKSQLKVMAQSIDDYKMKAKMLSKQNRDLQVVLKSVQEEQKKNSGSAITPLKITRSVGMQVLMTDKNSRKRQCLLTSQTHQNANINNQNTTSINNKNQNKIQVNQNTRATKPQQQIPVPRLIPAVNIGTKPGPNPPPQAVNNPSKSPTVNNIPNGMKNTSPAVKPEKRSHSKMQQNNSVTVDLTDDEPPAKVNNRNFNSSVRCVPPQTLLAPQRAPLPQSLNSPKKVYIPISGPQSQNIRPGQTIMLKSVPSQAPRPRGPSANMKMGPSNNAAIRSARVAQRHPAPLPDYMKQYQPPNWKALPPAPELKLAKVENGIVISWKIDGYREENHEEIASYQLFAYQETSSPPNTSLWKKIGDVKALPLPMACTLTQFMSGYKYYFAVRAVDVRSRFGPFSLPGSILLLKNQ